MSLGILNNPVIKKMLTTAFTGYMKDGNLHGIYVCFDDKGEIELRDCKTDPQAEIDNLKKIIYNNG